SRKIKNIVLYALLLLVMGACEKSSDSASDVEKPEVLPGFDSTAFVFDHGIFPAPNLPTDNPLTVEKVKLGKMLFYDPILSKDELQSCSDCHIQVDGFSDIRQFSLGVEDLPGKRQAMALFNMAWHNNGFFWDGRAPLLRDQALMPIEDPLEMNETLENAINKLKDEQQYRFQFARAFEDPEITEEKLALAIESFMLTIVSNNSKFDKFLVGEYAFTDSEQRGYDLFFTEFDPNGTEKGGECFHCHAGINFTNDKYMNNGLDTDAEFTDEGYFATTENPEDMARFKVPSLRNIAVTAPYMHDGRFQTLEEVIDHYNIGVKESSTIDEIMQFNLDPGLDLSEQDKAGLVAFLKTLTDETFLNNPEYADPF
ncbi:MAG: c-type cytochrome, partial [Bacteroidales bacterium]|nr:c-type cytochrome [Bacteroidales bacterium]